MRIFLLDCLLSMTFLNSDGQVILDKSCHTDVELSVVLDTVYHKMESFPKDTTGNKSQVDFGCYCNPCYILRPLNEKYKVISFIMTLDSPKNSVERRYSGDTISCNNGMVQINMAVKTNTISITCIKARHENGNVYTLKNFIIRF